MQWSNLDLPHCRQILYCLSHEGNLLVNEKLCLPSWFVQVSAMASIRVYMPPVLLSASHLFAFSYCSWGSQGKNAEVVCHSLLQWTTFCWRRLLRVPWTARRSNRSILEEINPEYLLEGLMLKLKLQYFGHLMRSANSLEKTLMLGGFEGREKKGMIEDEMVRWHHWLNGHEFEQALGIGDGQGSLACCRPWGHEELGTTKWLNSNKIILCLCLISTFSPEQTSWASEDLKLFIGTLMSLRKTFTALHGVPCLLLQNYPYWILCLVFCDVPVVRNYLAFSKREIGFMSLCFCSHFPERLSSLYLLIIKDSIQAGSCFLLKDPLTVLYSFFSSLQSPIHPLAITLIIPYCKPMLTYLSTVSWKQSSLMSNLSLTRLWLLRAWHRASHIAGAQRTFVEYDNEYSFYCIIIFAL